MMRPVLHSGDPEPAEHEKSHHRRPAEIETRYMGKEDGARQRKPEGARSESEFYDASRCGRMYGAAIGRQAIICVRFDVGHRPQSDM
jgi:hypothetical protein